MNSLNSNSINFKYLYSINAHNNWVTSVSLFPSGNIISVSNDRSIKIYNTNFDVLQTIIEAHDGPITYVDIKDENQFVTCSDDKNIKLWIKNQNKYVPYKTIFNAHLGLIYKVIYYQEKIFSCSLDNTIKIWEEINENIQNITTLTNFNRVLSILYLDDKKLFVSSGLDGTRFWSLNNYELIIYIKDAYCGCWNALSRVDENKIIIGGDNEGTMKIISISEKKVIKEIHNLFPCWGIKLIENTRFFLVGGMSKNIKIYKNDNYECIQIINNAHEDFIKGFVKIKEGIIASFSQDGNINLWSI